MAKSKSQPEPIKRPNLSELLAHSIRKADSGNDGSADSYGDWLLDHAKKPRFYLAGFTKVRSATRQTDAKYFYAFAERAIEIAQSEGWHKEIDGAFLTPASYNQFRNAAILQRPMYFEHAAQVLLTFECALAAAIERGRYAGELSDVYDMVRILPACYNLDGFNAKAVESLRAGIPNFDVTVLSNMGQKSKSLLDNLAGGSCVTRKTARALRDKVLNLLTSYKKIDVDIGDVRGRPGQKKLGHKNATTAELVELDDWKSYV